MDVTVVMPTRHEEGNVPKLIERFVKSVYQWEDGGWRGTIQLLFVDDSDNSATVEVIEKAAEQYGSADLIIQYIHRGPGERKGGLSGAIVCGLRAAKFANVVCADSDQQHPPEWFLRAAVWLESGVDMVLPTRYRFDGSAPGLPPLRYLVSRVSGLAARLCFPKLLESVSDPTSGFFAVRRDAIDLDALNPMGFKILIEILVRCGRLRVIEIGYPFEVREHGKSNATAKQGVLYLKHLGVLRRDMLRQAVQSRRTPISAVSESS